MPIPNIRMTSETRADDFPAADIRPFDIPAAWDARTLQRDDSWIIRLTDADRRELEAALAFFKDSTDARGLTAQWLHGHMMPTPDSFPLPRLGARLARAQADLEHGYGLALIRGFPAGRHGDKDTQLIYGGLCSHIGTLRPQTVFGELVQEIRDSGQASLRERRGSKHNRALSFHNDPCDVISLLCLQPAHTGGEGLFLSSVSLHNALLASEPQHVRTLYENFTNTYQDYLFVRTGSNGDLMPRETCYAMPTFSVAQGHFACKYSRFYIDQAQELPGVEHLTPAQRAALDSLEREMQNEKWWLRIRYEPGDAVFSNNFVCMHARTAFSDDPADERRKRHLLRIWLAAPNSRPLSPRYRHYFFPDVAAGAIRGGLPLPPLDYA